MISLSPFKEFGLLGINRRNASYILPRNPRRLYPLVDDKLKTKELLGANRLPVPELYFSIAHNFESNYLRELKFLKQFVIKPARGSGGKGILVIIDKNELGWVRIGRELLSASDLEYHISNILAGLYSLGGLPDKVIIEYRVRSHLSLRPVAFQGVPDIRIILYRGIPVMSMLRFPTKESGGKANLHEGAIGVGVDMLKGITLNGVYHDKLIERHPDTRIPISGIQIPFWDLILNEAAKIFDVFKLGYMGIDFVVDQALGPLILELNARPGLNIQLANGAGLLPRLNAVDALGSSVENMSFSRRVELAREITKCA
ncbi:MAG: alpha-L-glutamate ligase-like protein [Candidatus Omnitrophica bacterium]|nr:alpha-L-glutamate ligase-like protein [Candidatus Omnitrophota bacterium]